MTRFPPIAETLFRTPHNIGEVRRQLRLIQVGYLLDTVKWFASQVEINLFRPTLRFKRGKRVIMSGLIRVLYG